MKTEGRPVPNGAPRLPELKLTMSKTFVALCWQENVVKRWPSLVSELALTVRRPVFGRELNTCMTR
jgi:hypothetical protein